MAGLLDMDSTRCITENEWERYSKKLLNENELLQMQAHVGGCELCADIKEGIDAMKKPELLINYTNSIQAKVDTALKAAPVKNKLILYWSAAAILILGFGITWFVLSNNPTPIADIPKQNNTEKPLNIDTNTSNKQETLSAHHEPPITDNTRVKSVEAIGMSGQNTTISEQEAQTKKESSESAATEDMVAMDDAKDVVEEKTQVIPSTVKQPRQDTIITAYDAVVAANTKKLEEADSFQNSTLNEGVVATKTKSRKNANAANKEVAKRKAEADERSNRRNALPSSMNNTDYNYKTNNNSNSNTSGQLHAIDSTDLSLAKINFEKGYDDKAITNLYYITLNPNSDYYEEGLLLKAKILIKQNKNEDAKVALNTIIKLNKEKRKEAAILLKSIK